MGHWFRSAFDLHANTCNTFGDCSTYVANGFFGTWELRSNLGFVGSALRGDIQFVIHREAPSGKVWFPASGLADLNLRNTCSTKHLE
jgi:hypothetical protein